MGGVLPGGSDSPYIGRSVDPKKSSKLLNQAIEAQTAGLVNFGLPAAQSALSAIASRPSPRHNIPSTAAIRAVLDIGSRLSDPLRITPLAPGQVSYFNPGTRDIGVLFESDPNQKVGLVTKAPVLLHELGHAINFDWVPYSQSQQDIAKYYGKRPNAGDVAAMSSSRGASDEDRPIWLAGVEGALSELMAPGTRHTLKEEAQATRNAFKLADNLKIPKGRGMLGAAMLLSTPALAPLAPGLGAGMVGTAGAKALNEVVRQETGEGIVPKVRQFLGTAPRTGVSAPQTRGEKPLVAEIRPLTPAQRQKANQQAAQNELHRRMSLAQQRFNPRKGEFGLSELLFGR